MSEYYEISSAQDGLTLGDHKGAASFSVRYVGHRQVEARARAVPLDGAEDRWVKVEPPAQFDLAPGQTQMVKVAVTIPGAVSPGRYGLRLDMLSVDNPDEEYTRGPVVTFYVEASEKQESPPAPKPDPQVVIVKHQAPRWAGAWFIFVAALALIILGSVLWVLFNMPGDLPIDRFFGVTAASLQVLLACSAAGANRTSVPGPSSTQLCKSEGRIKTDPGSAPGETSDA